MLMVNNLNGFGARRASVASTFSPTVKGTNAVLSNGDRNLTTGVAFAEATAVGTAGRSAGLLYFEIVLVARSIFGLMQAGLLDDTTTAPASLNVPVGDITQGIGWSQGAIFNTGTFSIVSTPATTTWGLNDVLQFAINFPNKSVWVGRNNVWNGATPSTGTTGRTALYTGSPILFPAASVFTLLDQWRICTTVPQLNFTPPPDYSAWG